MSTPPKRGTVTSYRHRQMGFFPVLSLVAVVVAMSIGPTDAFRSVAILAFSVVNVFLMALKGALTVRVSERRLHSYALGWNPPGRVVVTGLGELDLYLSQPWPPYVLVRSQEQTLIVNALWPERTQRLYQRLSTWPEADRGG